MPGLPQSPPAFTKYFSTSLRCIITVYHGLPRAMASSKVHIPPARARHVVLLTSRNLTKLWRSDPAGSQQATNYNSSSSTDRSRYGVCCCRGLLRREYGKFWLCVRKFEVSGCLEPLSQGLVRDLTITSVRKMIVVYVESIWEVCLRMRTCVVTFKEEVRLSADESTFEAGVANCHYFAFDYSTLCRIHDLILWIP